MDQEGVVKDKDRKSKFRIGIPGDKRRDKRRSDRIDNDPAGVNNPIDMTKPTGMLFFLDMFE